MSTLLDAEWIPDCPSSASLGFTDYSPVDILAFRYTFVNFTAMKLPDSPDWCAQTDRDRVTGREWEE